MVALSAFNTSTGGLAIGDWLYSAKPLAAPEYLPLNDDTASYLSSSYPTLAATYAPTAVAYSAIAKTVSPYGVTFVSSAYGGGTYAFLTAGGTVWTTTDFNSWVCSGIEAQPPAYSAATVVAPLGNWTSITYGKGKFVAVRSPPLMANVGASYGGSAVSYDSGLSWKLGTLPNTTYYNYGYSVVQISWTAVGYGNGIFFAVGWNYYQADGLYYHTTARSADGIYWEIATLVAAATTINNFPKMAYGASRHVFIASGRPFYVQNGSLYPTGGGNYPSITKSVAYGAGLFVIVGSGAGNANSTSYSTSPDGYIWTTRTLPASLNWTSVEFSNGYFVAVGQNATGAVLSQNAIATSTDGITWVLQSAATSVYTRGIAVSGKGKFFFLNAVNGTTGDLISISAAASTFSLPFIPAVGGTQTFMKAT